MRLSTLCLSVVLALASCAPEPEPATDTLAQSEQSASLKLYVFDCGRLRINDEQFDAFGYGLTSAETDVRDFITPCYVIEHERGRLLWDGGLASATADVKGWQDGVGGFQLRLVLGLVPVLTHHSVLRGIVQQQPKFLRTDP